MMRFCHIFQSVIDLVDSVKYSSELCELHDLRPNDSNMEVFCDCIGW